ncbi:MAG: DUF5691 domain-containing protein [Candidatus Methylacidiphilales bacterium]|nr:DUF5691 domain-containing protein [Candidatus Methylacidiphilales bacterium]
MIHEVWKELAAVALVGTQRTPPPVVTTGDPRVDALLAQLDPSKREEYVLQAAAILSLVMKAGQLPESIISKPDAFAAMAQDAEAAPAAFPKPTEIQALASIVPAPAETLQVCSDAASTDFLVLVNTEKQLVGEWLLALAASGRRLRPEILPEALDWGAAEKSRAELLRPVLGSRGEWLAAANPLWRKLLEPRVETAALWEKGDNTVQRAKGLRAIREEDPGKARELLEAVWKTEASQDRAEFIEVLGHRLSADDVPFLEAALADKRKEVREHAALLLKRLPDSPFCLRMRERAGALVQWKKGMLYGGSFTFSLPDEPTPEMALDGITVANISGVGKGAQILRQVLVATPLDFWADIMGRKRDDASLPGDVIAALDKAAFSSAALGGIAGAAACMRNAFWIEGWLREIAKDADLLKFWDAGELSAAISSLPPDRQQRAWIGLVQQFEGKPLAPMTNVITALEKFEKPWPKELTAAIYKTLLANRAQARAAYGEGSDWQSMHAWSSLISAAQLHADIDVQVPVFTWPELTEEEKKRYYYSENTGSNAVEKLQTKLDLRRRLRQNLTVRT